MIIKTEDFKRTCSTVLAATDTSEISALTSTLELKTSGTNLYLNVSNGEYYVSVKFELDHEENFHASVNANLFLKLISAITTEDIELSVHSTFLKIKANGNYKVPLIFEKEEMMTVPVISIENKTAEMQISSDILNDILVYNGRQITGKFAARSTSQPVQKMFYIDQEGCITFNGGACVTEFTLEKPLKLLLNSRLVNLFRLFKNTLVNFTLGYDPYSETIIQTKVSFETPNIKLTAITSSDDRMLNAVPVTLIRNKVNGAHNNKVVLSKDALIEALDRLLLFENKDEVTYNMVSFGHNKMVIYDAKMENSEELIYENDSLITETYDMKINLAEVKRVIDGCGEQYITLSFGDYNNCVFSWKNVKNIVFEGKR